MIFIPQYALFLLEAQLMKLQYNYCISDLVDVGISKTKIRASYRVLAEHDNSNSVHVVHVCTGANEDR